MKKLILAAAVTLSAAAFALALDAAPVLAASHVAGHSGGHTVGHSGGGSGGREASAPAFGTGTSTGSSDGLAGCRTYTWNCR
jgi:hypothetical protein